MRTFFKNSLLGLMLCMSGLLSCANMGHLAGAGSETTNSLMGMVASANGTPAENATVKLIPALYNPVKDRPLPDSFTTTTDSLGKYEFQNVDIGIYNIFIQSQSGTTSALVFSVHAIVDTVAASRAILSQTGAVKVFIPQNNNRSGYVYVPGTPLFVKPDSSDKPVVLGSVPPAVIPEITYSSNDGKTSSVIRYNIAVKSEDTVVAANPAWAHSRRLFLNTTTSGASTTNPVYNFPVLVRLNQSTFDFSQAKAGGADIRFTTPDNQILPYEIQRWDSENKEAEVWVRVDTIHGNDNHQFFVMYWGNPDAQALSNSAATFDTSKGFQGVWHLEGNGSDTAYDATANRYNGTPINMTAASSVTGYVGMARNFDSSYIVMKNTASSRLNFDANGDYSVSAWVYANMIDSIPHAIASKGHEQYYLQLKGVKNNRATWEFVDYLDQKGWVYTEDSIPPQPGANVWVFLTGVHSGTSQKIYINGKKVDEKTPVFPGNAGRNSGDNFIIGSHGRDIPIPYPQGYSYFKGKIDEVRVSSVAQSDDWIRLCYLNQKADDALVVFEK
jgi:hypothetical protein